MNINEQLEKILADLGVEMEYAEFEHYDENSVPEISIFQSSRDHYGVFYRLDIIDGKPELRVMVPNERGDTKMDIYLVRLSGISPLSVGFAEMTAYEGSAAYEHSREATLQHMLYAVAEMMKLLFWAGDLPRMSFPHEIEVYPLSLQEDKKTRWGRGGRL